MMRKLWVQLTMAFSFVIVVAVLIIAVAVNRRVDTQFRSFLVRYPLVYMAASLTEHYEATGSWEGVDAFLMTEYAAPNRMRRSFGNNLNAPQTSDDVPFRPFMPQNNHDMHPFSENDDRQLFQAPFVLTDVHGNVIYDGLDPFHPTVTAIPLDDLHHYATPIFVEHELVGYVMVRDAHQLPLPQMAIAFLSQVNQTLFFAGLIAGGFGVLLGLAIARGLSAPLHQLEETARLFSQGHLEQRVACSHNDTEEVANVARAFNEMADSLEHTRQLQRNMVADVAHELRTPLSVLQGNLQAILEDVYPLDKKEITTLYDETLILHRLVNDLHQLSQAEAGTLRFSKQTFAIAPLVERDAAIFQDVAHDKAITISLVVAPELAPVYADPSRVRQVLVNLLSNALRHTQANGNVTVQVVETTLDSGKQGIRVSVQDTGIGIASEHLPYVFERFWRADTARSRDQGGSGLGLAIARYLVEAQGGTIGVESEKGHGSCFWFTLPFATPLHENDEQ